MNDPKCTPLTARLLSLATAGYGVAGEAAMEIERLREALSEAPSKKLWECPECLFGFDAMHTDHDGGYTCPACAQDRLQGALDDQRAALAAIQLHAANTLSTASRDVGDWADDMAKIAGIAIKAQERK